MRPCKIRHDTVPGATHYDERADNFNRKGEVGVIMAELGRTCSAGIVGPMRMPDRLTRVAERDGLRAGRWQLGFAVC
jgi:hypothetical protein